MDYHGLSWIIMDYHGLLWTIMDYHGSKVCRLDDVQLEDDIGYIKSYNTDLSSSN